MILAKEDIVPKLLEELFKFLVKKAKNRARFFWHETIHLFRMLLGHRRSKKDKKYDRWRDLEETWVIETADE